MARTKRADYAAVAGRLFVLLLACVTFGEMTDLACGDVAGHGGHAEMKIVADPAARQDAGAAPLLALLPAPSAVPTAPAAATRPMDGERLPEPSRAEAWPPGLRPARGQIPRA